MANALDPALALDPSSPRVMAVSPAGPRWWYESGCVHNKRGTAACGACWEQRLAEWIAGAGESGKSREERKG